jgi:glycosyltransferase involved in cell wall biosynthesis
MKNKNLLIISQRFPSKESTNYDAIFIKEQLEFIKEHFKKIYVIVPTPYVPRILSNLKILPDLWKTFSKKRNYNYSNVHVLFPRFLISPFFSGNLGEKMFNVSKKTIEKKKINFDIIHAHFTYPSGYVGAMIKKISKKPLVITVHEDSEWLKREMKDDNCIFSWRNADAIIRVNKRDLYRFYEKGIPPQNVKYIPNGYDHNIFREMEKNTARKILGLGQDKKIILNIGRLEERKGQKLLIKVLKSLKKKYRNLQLIIIGGGPLKTELENMIKSMNLENFVILAGENKKREEIPLWINASDIFVLSSYSEGNPTVMFEALGCCIPYLGSDVGGSSDIINNDDIGMLFNPYQISDFKKKLEKAIINKWDKKKIKKYSRQYSWKSISLKIIKVYDKVIS